jgi:Uma2 family endonuclease
MIKQFCLETDEFNQISEESKSTHSVKRGTYCKMLPTSNEHFNPETAFLDLLNIKTKNKRKWAKYKTHTPYE